MLAAPTLARTGGVVASRANGLPMELKRIAIDEEENLTDIADYQWLVSEEASRWLVECAQSGEQSHRLQERLRKLISPERARLIVQQSELRQ